MRILITGGTGFIGSRLALRCLEAGDEVRILGQENTPAEERNRRSISTRGAEIVLGSILEPDLVRNSVAGVDIVFHLAAAQHEMNVPDRHFHEVNVEGTKNVLDAAAAAGIDRFVQGSTIGVYGNPSGVIDETTVCRPEDIYGETKLAAERRVLDASERVPGVVVRIPETYGPGDRRLLKLYRSIDRGIFLLVGSGENWHHPIYVEDLVEGLVNAAREPRAVGEILLLAGPAPLTTREMVGAIAGALGRPAPRLRVPLAPFAALATLFEATLRPLGIQPPVHHRRLDFFRKSFRLDASKARERIAFSPRVDFREGARHTAAWYRDRGYL